MTKTLLPGPAAGTVCICASKSLAHRLLIGAALGKTTVRIACNGISRDIAATADCLRALGASIPHTDGDMLDVTGIPSPPDGEKDFCCGESGSTLRFLLPVAGALGVRGVFHMEGRLPRRPMRELVQALEGGGMTVSQTGTRLSCRGQLAPGAYTICGNVSSQYISGLLLALPLLEGDSTLTVTEPVESAPYVAMTEAVLRQSGIRLKKSGSTYEIPGRQTYRLPAAVTVEGDYSNGAYLLAMGALSPAGIRVEGLRRDSVQGDRAIVSLLAQMGAEVTAEAAAVTVRRGTVHAVTIDGRSIPDLVPVLAVVAACGEGTTVISGAGRLRLKESDRIASTAGLIRSLGGTVTETPDGLIVRGTGLTGGIADPQGDHRIAMAAAVAACACKKPVTVTDAWCTEKSYPAFWAVLDSLKGAQP